MSKTILVTGSTGLIGSSLIRLLLQKGHFIHQLTRKKDIHANPRIKTFFWNLEKKTIDKACIEGVDVIVHLAGENIAAKRWTSKRKKDIIDSRVNSISLIYQLLQESPSHHVKSIISASAIGFYGDRGNEVLTEASAPGLGFLSQSCIAWENAVDQDISQKFRIVKFRTGLVLAEGGALKKIAKPIKSGIGSALGDGKQWVSWIYLNDVVEMYRFAIENESIQGTFNMVSPQPVTNEQLTKSVAAHLKKTLWLPMVPEFVLHLALGEMSAVVLDSTKADANKILEHGFKFRYADLDAALTAIYAT